MDFLGRIKYFTFSSWGDRYRIKHLDGAQYLILMRFGNVFSLDQMDNISVYLSTGKVAWFGIIVMPDKSSETILIAFDHSVAVSFQHQRLC